MSRFVDRATSCAPSVLLVDDEIAVRGAMRRYFSRNGWNVREAEDGASARCLLDPDAGHEFDLVICDLRMPIFSGPDLYNWLSNNRPNAIARLVFSTGDMESPDSSAFLSEAGRPVLPKPFELSELRRVVEEVRGSAQAA
ncbi:MAG TPA: response regulator [Gemmatimonadaceae bacterium]|nr:response regulator [Gemmatimonadaceae bacterium]